MVNRSQRTSEQQEYRDNFAHDLKELRKYGDTGKELANTLLDSEKDSPRYLLAKYGKTKEGAIALLTNCENVNINILSDFPENSLDQDVVNIIVGRDDDSDSLFILEHPTLFKKPIDIDKVLDKIIENGQGDLITNSFGNLKSFIDTKDVYTNQWYKDLIFKILNKAKKTGLGELRVVATKIAENINKIDGLSAQYGVDIGNRLSYNGFGDIIIDNIKNFSKFYKDENKNLAFELLLWNNGESPNFLNLLDMLIDKGYGNDIVKKMEEFYYLCEGENKQLANSFFVELIKKVNNWPDVIEKLAKDLGQLKGLNDDIAKLLIDNGKMKYVAKNIGSFEGIGRENAKKLIKEGYKDEILSHPGVFGLKKER